MLQSWQQLVNRQILPSRLKRYKLIYRDSEILTENYFPLIDKHLQLWGFFSQEKPHLESVLKLALLQDEIMKLAKSVFPAPALSVLLFTVWYQFIWASPGASDLWLLSLDFRFI